jgi:hypothetical protein
MAVADTLAYYDMATITAVIIFTVKAPRRFNLSVKLQALLV